MKFLNQKGMTIIELISTIAIASGIAIIALPKYEDMREEVREEISEFSILSEVNEFYENLKESNDAAEEASLEEYEE